MFACLCLQMMLSIFRYGLCKCYAAAFQIHLFFQCSNIWYSYLYVNLCKCFAAFCKRLYKCTIIDFWLKYLLLVCLDICLSIMKYLLVIFVWGLCKCCVAFCQGLYQCSLLTSISFIAIVGNLYFYNQIFVCKCCAAFREGWYQFLGKAAYVPTTAFIYSVG